MTKLKLLFVFIVGAFLSFIAWMNITPGYYRYHSCGCIVRYMTDYEYEQGKTRCSDIFGACVPPEGLLRNRNDILLILSKLDFNR